MAANVAPVFGLVPLTGFATVLAANTATDGTGTVAALITMGGNGGRLDRIRLVPLGTNIATKAYIFGNNGATQATASNNYLILDIPLLSSTASNVNQIGAPLDFVLGLVLPAGHIINATLATAVAVGWKIMAFGVSF
jgi:hypothetical protein